MEKYLRLLNPKTTNFDSTGGGNHDYLLFFRNVKGVKGAFCTLNTRKPCGCRVC